MKRTLADIVGLESIYFQNDNTGKEIEALIEKIRENVDNKTTVKTIVKTASWDNLQKYLSKRFGFNLELIGLDDLNAYFYPTGGILSMNNLIFNSYAGTGVLEDELKTKNINFNERGGVDLKHAKIYGIFSEIPITVALGLPFFTNTKFTPAHITAILLHELGHAFSIFEYLGYSLRTNYVLNYISATYKRNPDKVEFALKKAEESLDLDNGQLKAVYNEKDSTVALTVVSKLVAEKLQGELFEKNNEYQYNVTEIVADDFSSRLGYAKNLAEGLHLMLDGYYGRSETGNRIGSFILDLTNLIVGGVLISALIASPGLPLLLTCAITFFGLYTTSDYQNYAEVLYDFNDSRFRRMKNNAIAALKENSNDKNIRKMVEDIETIEKIIKKYQANMPRVLFAIRKFFSSTQRKEQAIAELSRDLENIAYNDLYISAAKFKTLHE